MSIVYVPGDYPVNRDEETADDCGICFEGINSQSERYLPKCHKDINFHEKCIIEWIRNARSKPLRCPWCDKVITDETILKKSQSNVIKAIKVIGLGTLFVLSGAAAMQIFRDNNS